MKRTLSGMLALLAGAYAVHAQGTISFANYGTGTLTYLYIGYKPNATSPSSVDLGGSSTGPVAGPGNATAVTGNGLDWTVALYGAAGSGDASSTLSQLPGASTSLANGATDGTAGTWFSDAVITVPGTTGNGSPATVQLFAWYNEGGLITTYAQALADGLPIGASNPANVTLGGPQVGLPPTFPTVLPLAALGNFNVIGQVPEPSTIALGVIGASTFLMRLRRKQ
jgi:hypothetical protein